MTHRTSLLAGLATALLSLEPAAPGHDYPVQPVPFTAVHLDDVFWAPRIETNRHVSIPFAFQQCELSGRIDNFERAAKALRGEALTKVTFAPVTTSGLRLEVTMQPQWSAGVQKWRVR